ncbi:MAG TPA: MlaD family protein [Usitatibacteraceae bacterium]
MTDFDISGAPKAEIVRRRWPFSPIWIIPIAAGLIAIGLAMEQIARQGPTVTISFKAAGGIVAGKTPIKYKDVTIGLVSSVRLSSDYSTVEVSAKISREAAGLMTEGASFWIVRPRATLSEVSGLNTLLSGNYIGFDRGKSGGDRRQFIGLETARVIEPDTPGRQFTLHTADAQHIEVGLPVYFRGLQVGQVTAYDLAPGGHAVDLKIFVNKPYEMNIHQSTKFWNASGLDVSVGAGGLSMRTESLLSLVVGGLAFDNDPLSDDQSAAAEGSGFTLYRDRTTAMRQPDPNERRYVLYFNESLLGVATGSPVTLLGIQAGEVTNVGIAFDKATRQVRGRLEIMFSPERLIERLPEAQIAGAHELDRNVGKRNALLEEMIKRHGLRAQLRTANFVTGQRYLAFEYFPHPPVVRMKWGQDPVELPVIPSTLPAFEEKLGALLTKLESLPLGELSADAQELMREAQTTLKSMNGLVKNVDDKALPNLVAAVEDVHRTLSAAERMLDGASTTLVGPDAPGQRELRSALQEMTRAARSLRVLSESLEQHPESLLRGRSKEDAPQ